MSTHGQIPILRVGATMLRHHIERHIPEPFYTPTQLQRWDSAVTALIRKGQFRPELRPFQQFCQIAA